MLTNEHKWWPKKGEETVTPFFIQGQAYYLVPVSSRKVVISLRKIISPFSII